MLGLSVCFNIPHLSSCAQTKWIQTLGQSQFRRFSAFLGAVISKVVTHEVVL